LCGITPFDDRNIKLINENIKKKKVNFKEKEWKNVSSNAKDFVLKCLDRDQNKRQSIADLFDHPFICEVPENDSINEEIVLNIQQNLIHYNECSEFQKMVLSLVSGLATTQE